MLQQHRRSRRIVEDDADEIDPEKGADRTPEVPLTFVQRWLPLAVVFVAIGLGGSKQPWVLALLAALISLNLALVPRMIHVSHRLRVTLLVLGVLPLAGMLPFSAEQWPEWRKILRDEFGISLASMRSPQPGLTLESWLLFVLGLVWFWHCFGRGFAENERRRLVRTISAFIAVIAATALVLRHLGWSMPALWRAHWAVEYFGPFPNRNNFGTLLAMGSVLAFAATYDALRRKSPAWFLHALCLVPVIWALVENTSRGGVVLFFIAIAAWMGVASFSKRSAQRLGVAAACLITLVAVFIISGSRVVERFKAALTRQTEGVQSGRTVIFLDTFKTMIARSPFLGCGLGNFEPVFAMQKEHINNYSRDIHPESDWLWLAAEAGIPAVLVTWFALGLYLRRTGPWRSSSSSGASGKKDRRLRNACAVAALVLPVAAIFDTSAHQPGVVFPAMLLAGMSLRRRRRSHRDMTADRPRPPKPVLVVLCAGCAIFWTLSAMELPFVPGRSAASVAADKAQRLYESGDLEGAHAVITRAINRRPMAREYYFQRAAIALPLGLSPQTVLEDFLRERYLEPQISLICDSEAFLWKKYYPQYAPQAWQEGMRRDPERAPAYYNSALGLIDQNPELRPAVRSMALTAGLKLAYLSRATKEEFDSVVREILDLSPELEALDPAQRLQFFRLWYAFGNRKDLVSLLQQKPHWRSEGWPILAQDRADAGNYAAACQVVLDNVTPPTEGSVSRGASIDQLVRNFYTNRLDIGAGFELLDAQKARNLTDEALVTLGMIAALPDAPARVFYEEGLLLSRKGESAKAWEKLKLYIEKRPLGAGAKS